MCFVVAIAKVMCFKGWTGSFLFIEVESWTMRFMMRHLVFLTFAILAVDIGFCQSPETPPEIEVSTVEPGTC